jgi:hypothetical protein
VKNSASDREHVDEYHDYVNEKSVVETWRVDRQKCDTVLAEICSHSIGKNDKIFDFNTNNAALEIIAREHNYDFHRTNRDIHISTFSGF